MGGIFLIQNDGTLVEMHEQRYDSEELLQNLLSQYPDLLAGDQMDSNAARRWIHVKKEMGIPGDENGNNRWSVDHLFLDQDAIPTLIEVKRSTDTRIRREVVGQMLDYAANAVVYWPVEELRYYFEQQCEGRGTSADAELEAILGDEVDIEGFWQKVKTNLQAGHVRMVFVADVIPRELRRIVEFLNQQMDPAEVLALEIKQFIGSGLRTLVPKVIGMTAEAEQRKGTPTERRKWDEASFFDETDRVNPPAIAHAMREIYDWLVRHGAKMRFGVGRGVGNVIPSFQGARGRHTIITLCSFGSITAYFGPGKAPPFDERAKQLELLDRFNSVPGINMKPELDKSSYPGVQVADIINRGGMPKLFEVLDWAVKQIEVRRA